MRGFDLRGLYARASLDEVGNLNRARNLAGLSSIGQVMKGGYAQFGYNVLSQVREGMALTPFYRYERIDTHDEVAPGFAADPVRDGTFHSAGVQFQPIQNIVVKSDYQWIENPAKTGVNQFN